MISSRVTKVTKNRKILKRLNPLNSMVIKRLILVLLIVTLLQTVSAAEPDFFFQRQTDSFLTIDCTNPDDSKCTSSVTVNLSISYPNGSFMVQNDFAEFQEAGLFRYNLSAEHRPLP